METITCQNCGELIIEAYSSYSFVAAGNHQQDLYMVKLSGAGNNAEYRFFCTNCGTPATWSGTNYDIIQTGDSREFSFRPFHGDWPFAKTPPIESVDAIFDHKSPSVGIRECAEAFASNIARVNAVGQFAILAAGLQRLSMTLNLLMSQCKIMERARSGTDPGTILDSPYTCDFLKWYLERANLEKTPISDELLKQIHLSGQIAVETWSGVHPEIATGIQTIMLAQITLAWTAFEVLSADLWVAAVNERPKPLAMNFARSVQQKGQDKSIPITALAELGDHDFNLSKSMGTLFAQQKKVDFTSLSTTQFAYEKAFGNAMPALDGCDLRLLGLLRNLILHRGGVVDRQFMDEVKEAGLQSHPDCSAMQIGIAFTINPEVASRLVAASVDAGKALLEYVVH